MDKILPQNIEAEQVTLGSIISDNSILPDIFEIIKPEDFYKDANKIIYKTILELYNNGSPIDLLILTEKLKKEHLLNEVGGVVYVAKLVDYDFSYGNVLHYAKIIREKSILRQLITNSYDIINAGFSGNNIDEIIESATQKFINITSEINKDYKNVLSINDVKDSVISYYNKVKSGVRGITTPWPTMNDMIVGWQPEDFVIFIGRTSSGKSWTLIILTKYALENNHKVLFISPEMSRIAIAIRFLSYEMKFSYKDFRAGRLGEFAEKDVIDAIKNYDNKELFLMCGSGKINLSMIENSINIYKPDIVFIDGMYLVEAEGKDRYERMCNVADGLKSIAKRFSIPVIGTTQFNRNVKKSSRTAETRDVGLTDVLSWNASYMFGLLQDADMARDKKMLIYPLKVRESEPKEFYIHWNFDDWDFSEIRPKDNDYEDEEFEEVPF